MTTVGELFNDAAEHFERLAPALWNPMGNAVVAAAGLSLDQRVLDVCCGSGASTIPAAQEVGPGGRVDAVDLSSELLDLAAAKASALDIDTITFARSDAATWTGSEPYDAVLCCYGLFFLPDMAAGVRHLASQLRRGGRLAVSTWQEQAHKPFVTLFEEACFEEQPHLRDAPEPRPSRQLREISTPEKLDGFLASCGFEDTKIDEMALQVPLDAELAWELVLGTGYRALLPIDQDGRDRIRDRFLGTLGDDFALNADSLIAVASR
ncbi:methyltransferase domain-containing protein [Arthrobacter sp. JZ12]|uniref:class I SAM-dependent methyltransferase n=1 Tax=Arthrobacter sp. JZ12 TaxID=2654190 RepID=UPI002B45B1A8|nr:methyltransferase domain-containing protein [Arthrobacter sp. JZ12]WRH25425.1 methyltransferase domain-containing protein [Arthrobacter sp. JZ12]